MNKINKTLIIGINLCDFGSTGNIMRNSLEYARENDNFDYLVIVQKSEGKPKTYDYMENYSILDRLDKHIFHRSINNPDGFYHRRPTLRIINKIKEQCDKYKNVIVHMHNIHMANIDLRILFKYLSKENRINKVYYTLHDCWSFTGGCYHFERCGCDEWKTGCKGKCPQHYEKKFFSTAKNLRLKNKYTHLLKDKLTFIPVSHWCDNLLKQSLLGDINSIVIEGECNIIPVKQKDESLKEALGIKENEKVLLTVDGWKGYELLDQFIEKIPDGYKFILISGGKKKYTSEKVIQIDKVDNRLLPLFYSIADCFVSLTQEDTLPLTIMEAQLCGVPVVGFGHGGTPEEIIEGKTGYMVPHNNIDELYFKIKEVVHKKPFKGENVLNYGLQFSKYESAKKILKIYQNKK